MITLLSRTLFAVITVLLGSPAVAQHAAQDQYRELRPLSAEDAVSAISIANTPIDLSPDGRWLAYTIQDPKRARTSSLVGRGFSSTGVPARMLGTDIWITDTFSGVSLNLTRGKGNSWAPAWSPDSVKLAFYSDRNGASHLWVYNAATKESRQVSELVVRPYGHNIPNRDIPKWDKSGTKILTKVVAEGESLEQANASLTIPSSEVTRVSNYPDSVVTVYQANQLPLRTESSLQAPEINQNIFTRSHRADLALIDVQSGTTERLTRRFNPVWYEFSPDDRVVAFTHAKGQQRANNYRNLYDLMVVTPGKAPRVIASDVVSTLPSSLPVSFSPDGTWISYIAVPADGPSDCFLLNLLDGRTRKAAQIQHPDFTNQYRPPQWDGASKNLYFVVGGREIWRVPLESGIAKQAVVLQGRSIVTLVASGARSDNQYWSPDQGLSAVVQTIDDSGRAGLLRVNLGTGVATQLIESEKFYGGRFGSVVGSSDGKSVLYSSEDATHPEDLWIIDSEFRQPKQLTTLNPRLGQYVYGQSRIVEWLSSDGDLLRGALLLPSGYKQGEKYALVVCVYPGDRGSQVASRFGLFPYSPYYNMQVLATRGYAVLYPDTPIHPGTIMQDISKTVLPGVNKLIELGIADPDRLGVTGQSLGGYGTLSLIVQTNRFKAALMDAGLGNLTSSYGEMGKDGSSYAIGIWENNSRIQLGTPWTSRDRYIENSPVFYLDRVETPLLITHGSEDFAVAPFLAEEIFVDLRRLGKTVVYVKYEGEGHGLENYQNQLDFIERMINWFDKYLKL